jgi:hypothetical protein
MALGLESRFELVYSTLLSMDSALETDSEEPLLLELCQELAWISRCELNQNKKMRG